MTKDVGVKFPVWKGYKSIGKDSIEFMKIIYGNDIDAMAKGMVEGMMREEYFKDMLLFVQDRLDKHFGGDELRLCLNSANEIFYGIMISECDEVNRDGDSDGEDVEKKSDRKGNI